MIIKKRFGDAPLDFGNPEMDFVDDLAFDMESKMYCFGSGGGGSPGGGNQGDGGGSRGQNPKSRPKPKNVKPKPRRKPKPKPRQKPKPTGPKIQKNIDLTPSYGDGRSGPGDMGAQSSVFGSQGFSSRGRNRGRKAFGRGLDGLLRAGREFEKKEGLYGGQALRFDPTQVFGQFGLFARGNRLAAETGRQMANLSESGVPIDRDFMVEQQPDQEGPVGGEPGVGEQGFGRRAMLGGEGELAEDMSGQESYQTDIPAEVAQGDVAADPNIPMPTPNANIIPDVNYVVPTMEREENLVGFVPGDPGIAGYASGPLSRSLSARRAGFGNRIIVG